MIKQNLCYVYIFELHEKQSAMAFRKWSLLRKQKQKRIFIIFAFFLV
jgi:hypothetical protein